MTAIIPGSTASHNIITPDCRLGRGAFGAWDEAVQRAREAYDAIIDGWSDAPVGPKIHLVLTVERPPQRVDGPDAAASHNELPRSTP